jgi:hypothetical protein
MISILVSMAIIAGHRLCRAMTHYHNYIEDDYLYRETVFPDADNIGHSVCSAHMMASVVLAELIASCIHLRRPIRLHQYMIRSIVLMLSYGPT